MEKLTGGCLCGAIRYEISGEPYSAEYCHCGRCRRVSGGPAALWMDLKAGQLRWTAGQPKEYASDEHVRRGFCAECGTTLSFGDVRYPQYACLSITSLDEPERVVPKLHIWTEFQLPWFEVDDGAPRHARGSGLVPPP